jgi:antitoxin VapB
MSTSRQTIKLVRLGDRQTIQLPPEFELPGDEATIRRDGDSIVIEPVQTRGLLELLATLEPIEEEIPEIDDPPVEPEDIF